MNNNVWIGRSIKSMLAYHASIDKSDQHFYVKGGKSNVKADQYYIALNLGWNVIEQRQLGQSISPCGLLLTQAWYFTEVTKAIASMPPVILVPLKSWNAPIETYNFLRGYPLPMRTCLDALARSKTKHAGLQPISQNARINPISS